MFDLADISVFSALPASQLEVLRLSADQRHCAAGTIICRKGSIGRSFFVVAAGGVRVLHDAAPGRRSTGVFLGPGQVFGEMSLLSDQPVSATVVATTDTVLYTFPKRTLLTLFNDYPVVRDAVVRLLIDRLRHRSASDADRPAAPCALVVVPATHHQTRTVTEAIARAVAHYAPGSCIVDTRHPPTRDTAKVEPPSFFPGGIGPLRSRALGEIPVYLSSATDGWHRELIGAWRGAGSIGQLLLLVVADDQADDLSDVLIADDVVLLIIGAGIGETRASSDRVFGLAAVERLSLERRPTPGGTPTAGRWAFHLAPAESDLLIEAAPRNGYQPRRRRLTGSRAGPPVVRSASRWGPAPPLASLTWACSRYSTRLESSSTTHADRAWAVSSPCSTPCMATPSRPVTRAAACWARTTRSVT